MTTAAQAAFTQLNFPMLILVELDFADGIQRMCNAGYTFSWNGFDWLGLGNMGSIGAIPEGLATSMYGTQLTLSGVPTEQISESTDPANYQGRNATIWLAPLNKDYTFIADPVMVFSGRMDTMDIELGATASITLALESYLADWDRPRNRRFNDADQTSEFPNDRGFRYVDQMVEKELKWGYS
jgi:hypothetical protein